MSTLAGVPMTAVAGGATSGAVPGRVGSKVKLHVADVAPVRPNCVALTVQLNLVGVPPELCVSQARSAVNGLLRVPEGTFVIVPVFLTLVLPSFQTVKFSFTT